MPDEALARFDKLRVVEVRAADEDTASTFLARFQTAAAGLGSDGRIELEVAYDTELVEAVLFDPLASKICALYWVYNGEEDVTSIIPLLLGNCPELASLKVEFKEQSALEFISGVLEHSSSKVTVLALPWNAEGDFFRFFAALRQSQVSALTLSGWYSAEFYQGLYKHLVRDLLVRLKVSMDNKLVPLEMMISLLGCNRLAELEVSRGVFFHPTAFTYLSKFITKLKISYCRFYGGFHWSFLPNGSIVRELEFKSVEEVDGRLLGSALAVHLKAKGLDRLCFDNCDFADETLAAVGVEIGRIKRLFASSLNHASVKLISLVLQSPTSELRELSLVYGEDTASSIENHLAPVLRRSDCKLTRLSLSAYPAALGAAARRVEDGFYYRRALLVLLQGRQVRRRYCPLRRLPVEMFRLVGEVLL